MIESGSEGAEALSGAELSFNAALERCGSRPLLRRKVATLQLNLGRRCNLSCSHCHVEGGPGATEVLSEALAEQVLRVIDASPGLEVLDLTGGAPELCPSLERLVRGARQAGCEVLVRTNLAILKEPAADHWPERYAALGAHLLGSLPACRAEEVDAQRGQGVFHRSIRALQQLNACGYGQQGSGLQLDLVHNPLGAVLPRGQQELELEYRQTLGERYGISFDQLLVITNVPAGRFDRWLRQEGLRQAYLQDLVQRFNPATLPRLVCLDQLSVAWDGELFACDFNLGAGLGEHSAAGPRSLFAVTDLAELSGWPISTGVHCFACTAAAGSG